MKYFPILVAKLHYFFWYGALAGILPYYVVYVRNLTGLSPISMGTLCSILPFLSFSLNPAFCRIANKTNSHHAWLIIFITSTLCAIGSLLLLLCVPHLISLIIAPILLIVAHPSMATAITLADSVTIKIVNQIKDPNHGCIKSSFKNVRMWGIVGYGFFGFINGLLNQTRVGLPYLVPGLVMFILLMIVDLVTVKLGLYDYAKLEAKLEKQNTTCPIETGEDSIDEDDEDNETITKKNVATLNTPTTLYALIKESPSIIQNCITLTTLGILDSMHFAYFYWFLETISLTSSLLMGITLAVRSFGSELIFFVFGNKIVEKLGASNCLSISMTAWTIRFLCLSFFIFPSSAYFVLLIELLQGPTCSLLYCAMTHLGREYSIGNCEESETENNETVFSSLQGLFAGCRSGLGRGLGFFIGGFIIHHFGIRWIWTFGFLLALIGLLFNIFCDCLNWLMRKTKRPT